MELYTQGKKVGTLNSWDELRLGANHPYFIWQGDKLVYPNPVKDGLVLWYDFSGMTNTDHNRGTVYDLSGNGNHGTLQNFNYTADSGYANNSLIFDGVDDHALSEKRLTIRTIEFSAVLIDTGKFSSTILSAYRGNGKGGFSISRLRSLALRTQFSTQQSNETFNVSSSSDYPPNKKINCSIVFDDSHCYAYINGIETFKKEHGGYKPEQEDENIGLWLSALPTSSKTYFERNDLFSVRVYDRPLTPAEIQHNYNIEKERFGLE